MTRQRVEIRLLGPIEVIGADRAALDLGPRKQRALIAALALARGGTVSVTELIDVLWGDGPPAKAMASLQTYVCNLRRLLEPDRSQHARSTILVSAPSGYALRVDPDVVDARRFEETAKEVGVLVADHRWAEARRCAEAGLELWRGNALGEFANDAFALADATHMNELRLVTSEHLLEAKLAMRDSTVTADAERFVSAHPLREGGWATYLRALYADGRQTDALRAYQRLRSMLGDEVGIEPGLLLRAIERAILDHDDGLLGVEPGWKRSIGGRSGPVTAGRAGPWLAHRSTWVSRGWVSRRGCNTHVSRSNRGR